MVLSNTNNFQTDLFNLYMEYKKVLPLQGQSGPGSNGNEEAIAVTDLVSLANQCLHQVIRPHTDQSAGRAH